MTGRFKELQLTPKQIKEAIRINWAYLKHYRCPYDNCKNKPIYWACEATLVGETEKRVAIACAIHMEKITYKVIRELTTQEVFVLRALL